MALVNILDQMESANAAIQKELQDKLASNGKSARVIAVNADTKIYI